MRRARVVALFAAVLVLSLLSAPAGAVFPGRNGLIAFQSDRNGPPDIFTMRPDGTAVRNLTQSLAIDIVPSWSPDGEWITWARIAGTRDVWIMRFDGSNQRAFTSNPAQEQSPAFTRDGTAILYSSSVNDPDPSGCFIFACNLDVFRHPLSGGPPVQLTSGPAWDGYAKHSPDGTRIAFASNRSGHMAIYTMANDGSDVRRLTKDALEAAHPDWSPDGRRIVFVDNFCATCGLSDIWMVNADGSGLRRVLEGFQNELRPVWSPDGTRIVFTSGEPLPYRIYTMRPNGTDIRRVDGQPLSEESNDELPDWGVRRG